MIPTTRQYITKIIKYLIESIEALYLLLNFIVTKSSPKD